MTVYIRTLKIFVLLLAGVSVGLSSAAQNESRKEVSLVDGYRLAKAALANTYHANLPQLHLEEDKSLSDPHFYFFMGIWNNPAPVGSATAGSFAVQRETGDVWDGVTCEEVKAVVLIKIQKVIRKKLNLTASSYKSLRREPPGCE